jgi:prepilin-type N-terminal cleavage/methylation domain-containing protein
VKRRAQETSSPLRRGKDAGFTLVELLVGITLVAMIGMAMLLGFETMVPTWKRTEARAEATRSLYLAQDLLQRLLSQAYPAVIGEAGARRIDFAGGADRVEFLTPLQQRFGAMVMARYRLVAPGDGTLRLSSVPDLGADQDTATASEAIVLRDLAGIAVAYLGSDDPTEPPRWQDSWTNRKTLPDLIRVHLSRRDRSAVGWPDIVIAPLVTADADCSFDPRDGKCRG